MTRLAILIVVLTAFSALTAWSIIDPGIIGTFAHQFENPGGTQVLTDLVILAALSAIWIANDAPKHNISPWPYVAITVTIASFGPLLYLIHREMKMVRR